MSHDIIFAGFGGQGVQFIGTLLASAAVKEGKEVVFRPSYKGQIRGGISTCMINISSEPILSPVVDQYDTAVTLDQPSLEMFTPRVKPGGVLVWENSVIKKPPERPGIRMFALPAYNQAITVLKNKKMMNMIMFGALIAINNEVKKESIMAALRETLPANQNHLIPLNENAFDLGRSLVKMKEYEC